MTLASGQLFMLPGLPSSCYSVSFTSGKLGGIDSTAVSGVFQKENIDKMFGSVLQLFWWNCMCAIPGTIYSDIWRHPQRLNEIIDYEEAITSYNQEVNYFQQLGQQHTDISRKQSSSGLDFLHYLHTYLATRQFWLSWSFAGVMEAAKRMNTPVDNVPRTTNHLELLPSHCSELFHAYKPGLSPHPLTLDDAVF